MKVKELLSDESKWCKEFGAKDRLGSSIDALSPKAVCWCLMGAIYKCADHSRECSDVREDIVYNAECKLIEVMQIKHPQFDALADFNDHPFTTFKDIKEVLELANV